MHSHASITIAWNYYFNFFHVVLSRITFYNFPATFNTSWSPVLPHKTFVPYLEFPDPWEHSAWVSLFDSNSDTVGLSVKAFFYRKHVKKWTVVLMRASTHECIEVTLYPIYIHEIPVWCPIDAHCTVYEHWCVFILFNN